MRRASGHRPYYPAGDACIGDQNIERAELGPHSVHQWFGGRPDPHGPVGYRAVKEKELAQVIEDQGALVTALLFGLRPTGSKRSWNS